MLFAIPREPITLAISVVIGNVLAYITSYCFLSYFGIFALASRIAPTPDSSSKKITAIIMFAVALCVILRGFSLLVYRVRIAKPMFHVSIFCLFIFLAVVGYDREMDKWLFTLIGSHFVVTTIGDYFSCRRYIRRQSRRESRRESLRESRRESQTK